MHSPRYDLWFLALCSLFGLLLPLLVKPLTGSHGTLPWLLDLASHWQWLFLAGLIITALTAAWRERRWLFALLAAPLPWLTASPVLPSGDDATPLTVASANVHLSSRDVGPLRDWLAQARPEVVVLLEVSPRYAQALQTLPGYPYRLVHADSSPFGIALLSSLPLDHPQIGQDERGIPHLRARLQLAGCSIALSAFHPMPPLSPDDHSSRDRQLRELLRASGDGPALLAGDLNATPWSSAFAGLDALGWRRASGLAPTWPSLGAGVLGIPIDHVLASRHWRLLSSERGPDLGSDHLPVLVQLGLPGDDCRP
ncbi:endonuclease/exonuclease/phosphatase family protein [Pseudomonas sp. Gutcm_11s]|uniref:endonuclease/exonuclease/phosphatase family protein n=1 Tax=Pseudomonas sp. Gutcm_11s TaxID=3026088 RepID=UPI00235F9FBF|nr:endonuclease/exonuclease/phosphatase family protein [Pseudomonas sp. Gutcm_11s]MDD0843988.1 endonuclease/exonuclease/phosphatase family protein [Pseudomonas sp. Gutcm_11s]